VVLTYSVLKKICNPSLLSNSYFVLSSLLAKMSSKVSLFITIKNKLNLEGSCAFKRMPPRRSKIWKRSLFWLFQAASCLYELQPSHPLFPLVATPGKVSTAATAKIMYNIAFISTLFNKLIVKKRQFSKIITKLVYIYAYIFVIFSLYSLLLWQKPILYSNVSIFFLFFFHQKAAEILARRQH
jgi:hypothetical protein